MKIEISLASDAYDTNASDSSPKRDNKHNGLVKEQHSRHGTLKLSWDDIRRYFKILEGCEHPSNHLQCYQIKDPIDII